MTSVPILGDADVDALADMGELIGVIEAALRARADGALTAPPRHVVDFPTGDLVLTIGGQAFEDAGGADGAAGFRVYGAFNGQRSRAAQFTAVWNTRTAQLEGLVFGSRLGALRTGAIGGAAVRRLAREDASVLGMIGAGAQAQTQLMAICAVRPIRTLRVFSRSAEAREAFARLMSAKLGIAVEAVATAEAAVRGADIVSTATKSRSPVFEQAWLKPGVHINLLGPGGHEAPAGLCDSAPVLVTDALDQVRFDGAKHSLFGTPAWDRIGDLAEVAAGRAPGRTDPGQLTVFLSVGLGGTEVACAAHLLRKR